MESSPHANLIGGIFVFNEALLLNGESLENEKNLFYKNIAKLKIKEEDLKTEIGCGLTIENWFEFLFDLQDGYAAMFYLNINREVGQRMYLTDEAKKHVVISEFISSYVSMNTFYYPKRVKKAVKKLGFFYIDVDPRAVNLSKEVAFEKIKEKIEQNIIPKPSAIVDSGGGYYIIYKLDPVFGGNEKTLKLFGHIESFLVDMLEDVGGDSNAKDVCRVLRVPGTINGKYSSETFVKVIEFNLGLIYSFGDFKELMNKTNGFDLNAWRKLKEKQQLSPTEKKEKEVIIKRWTSGVKKRFSEKSLHATRSLDYKKIILMRGRRMEGYRNTILWLYGLTQKYLVSTKAELELKLREMNDMFVTSLTVKQVLDMATHCWEDEYRISNVTIIKKLQITPEEQKQMLTVIGKEEKYDRNNKRRTPRNEQGLTPRQQAKLNLVHKVKELHGQGLKQSEIASELNVTKGRVSQIMKELKR